MRLRQLSENDLSIRVRWMNDARIYSTMHFTPPILLSNTIQWFDCNKNNNKRKDFVLETFEGKLLTMSGLTGLDENILKMESYIFVDPDTKTRGLGKKTIFLQCLYAFETCATMLETLPFGGGILCIPLIVPPLLFPLGVPPFAGMGTMRGGWYATWVDKVRKKNIKGCKRKQNQCNL